MIRVDKDYFITADSNCFSACFDYHKTSIDKKTGEERMGYKVVGYYSDLLSALRGIRRHKIMLNIEENDYDLRQAIIEIKKMNDEITDLFEQIIAESVV